MNWEKFYQPHAAQRQFAKTRPALISIVEGTAALIYQGPFGSIRFRISVELS